MKGFRFFADAGSERSKSGSKKHIPFTRKNLRMVAEQGRHCNVVALMIGEDGRPLYGANYNMEAIAALSTMDNSGVCTTAVSRDYLDKHCVRIDEALARKLHPALFGLLDTP